MRFPPTPPFRVTDAAKQGSNVIVPDDDRGCATVEGKIMRRDITTVKERREGGWVSRDRGQSSQCSCAFFPPPFSSLMNPSFVDRGHMENEREKRGS